jgi:prepilin-type N-terminal cleavage/methylation domain-containing protein
MKPLFIFQRSTRKAKRGEAKCAKTHMSKPCLQLDDVIQRKINNGGFTLVELAIVLVMVGILIAGIVAGVSVLGNAKIQGLTKELQSYRQAAFLFKEKYQYWPGDMADAEDRWADAAYDVVKGDGDNLIGDANDANNAAEEADFFLHLKLSGFIPDVTSTTGGSLDGTNFPGSRIFPQAEFKVDNNGSTRNYIFAYHTSLGGGLFLNGKDMFYIDSKTDDGKANSGDLMTDGTGACADAVPGTYETDNDHLCYPRYYFNAN